MLINWGPLVWDESHQYRGLTKGKKVFLLFWSQYTYLRRRVCSFVGMTLKLPQEEASPWHIKWQQCPLDQQRVNWRCKDHVFSYLSHNFSVNLWKRGWSQFSGLLVPKTPKAWQAALEGSTWTHVKFPAIIPSAEFRLRLEPLLGVFQNRAQVLRPDREEAVGGCRAMSSGGSPNQSCLPLPPPHAPWHLDCFLWIKLRIQASYERSVP